MMKILFSNEVLLITSLIVIYAFVLASYMLFQEKGLFCWTVLATIAANIEVLILINAFGMSQTLGNILFASTFLVTDILSEVSGKKAANQAVSIGIFVSGAFIVISQLWFLFTPASGDWAMPHIQAVFSNTPRLMAVGLIVYAIAQRFDVWLYHFLWSTTAKHSNSTRKFLWLRNNGSTLCSQLLNAVLFTLGAFWGVYSGNELIDIMISSYIIFIFTSLLDTPVVYLARWWHDRLN
jgi:uncharacterized integral membrane protein (TIGR00697 family)